jgi:peroxiredoxin Q/BCP
MLAEGAVAPDFTALDQEGREVRLSDERGHWVLLWWYPKADTPG